MTDPMIVVTDVPDADAAALFADGLDDLILEQTGTADRRPLVVLVKDPDTSGVLGGLTGSTSLGVLFVDLFYLPPTLRGSGLGSEILRQAEQEALKRGCRTGMLYTLSFHAPGFYTKQGWRTFGEVPCDPPGSSRVFMTKELV